MAQEVRKNGANDDVNIDKNETAEKSNLKSEEKKDSDEYLLDMVFVLDCTGSMASYINSARDNIVKVSQELSKLSEKQSKQANNPSTTTDGKTEEKENNKQNDKSNDDVSVKDKDKNKNKDENMEGQIEGMVDTGNNDDNNDNEKDKEKENDKNKEKEKQDEKESDKKEKEKEKEKDFENKENDDESKMNNPEPKKKLSCKFAVVAYRDHPPQDSTFITQIRDFTGSSVMIKQYLSTLTANGGGDGPESLTTALYDTLHNLKYRENSQRIIIVITDAPCHGLEESSSGDGFPNGDPFPKWKLASKQGKGINKHKLMGVKTRERQSGEEEETTTKDKNIMPDILEIARDITDNLQASFYTVACEPCLSTSYDYARDFMEALAEMSNGKYVPLASANLLPKVIIGSVKQQMLIDELTAQIDKEIEELKEEYKKENKQLTEDTIAEFMEKKWENANLTYKEVTIGTLYRKERRRDNIEFLLNRQECKNLNDFRKKRIKLPRLNNNDFRHLSKGGSSSSSSSFGSRGGLERFSGALDDATMERSSYHRSRRSGGVHHHHHSVAAGSSASSFSFGGMVCSVKSFFGGGSHTITESKSKTFSSVPSVSASSVPSARSRKKKEMRKSGLTASSSSDSRPSSGSMKLAMRFGDDDDEANLSCSDDEQEVYEQVRSMDSKGVKKAVKRYMQTYY